MGLFSKKTQSEPTTPKSYQPSTEQEAWVVLFYSCMNADDDVSDSEIDVMSRLLTYCKKFIGYEVIHYYKLAIIASQTYSQEECIKAACNIISEEEMPSLFAMICELAYSDGVIGKEEEDVIELIAKYGKLSEEEAEKIVDVMITRFKYAIEIIEEEEEEVEYDDEDDY